LLVMGRGRGRSPVGLDRESARMERGRVAGRSRAKLLAKAATDWRSSGDPRHGPKSLQDNGS